MEFQVRLFLLLAVLLILCESGSCKYYQVTVGEKGWTWTTGIRESTNISLDISGSAIGEGTFSRYTEADYNDVRMRERIAAANGTLDTAERIRLKSDVTNPVEITTYKFPGGQDYLITVNETWPVGMLAQRRLDYMGKGIFDSDYFGNNLDYVGASYSFAKDLRMDRSALLYLNKAWFELGVNNTTLVIFTNRFLPTKSIDYHLDSLFQGTATFRYRQAEGHPMTKERHTTASEGLETYAGRFQLNRHIFMASLGRNSTTYDDDWQACCPTETSLEERTFSVSAHAS
ncbi:Uncharacterised protein [uncultured archaeon]|nr:Uncharacterised protein [uncultured archaeon]